MPRRRLREPFTYFVDECLGRHIVPDALRGAIDPAERVEILPQGTLDLEWIPLAHSGGWVCFTKDRALRHRPNELAALLAANIAVFVVGEARGEDQAARGTALVRSAWIVRATEDFPRFTSCYVR